MENHSSESPFFSWLAGNVSPAQLSSLYTVYPDISEFCLSRKILKKPLFETFDLNVLAKVRETVDRNQVFKFTYKKQSKMMSLAIAQYIKYVKEHSEGFQEKCTSEPPKIDVNIGTTSAINQSAATIIDLINNAGISFVDNRAKSGCLWIVGADELRSFVEHCEKVGVEFHFKEHARALGGNAGWWTDDDIKTDIKQSAQTNTDEPARANRGEFITWMSEKGIGNGQIIAHLSYVKRCGDFAQSNAYLSCDIYDITDPDTIQMVIGKVLIDPTFVQSNKKNQGYLIESLSLYFEYLKGKRITLNARPEPATGDEVAGMGQQETFKQWMLDKNFSTSTSRVYAYALAESSRYAVEHNISTLYIDRIADAAVVESCLGKLMSDAGFVEKNRSRNNQMRAALRKYIDFLRETGSQAGTSAIKITSEMPKMNADPRWKTILSEDFPDGYMLGDMLSQFQASGQWQIRYGEECSLQGEEIDNAIAACGTVMGGRVVALNEDDNQLIADICEEIKTILSHYSCVYTSVIYEKYRDKLMKSSIFTEDVMVQQTLQHAGGSFDKYYNTFIRHGEIGNVALDCKAVMRRQGGAVAVDDLAKELWFAPYDVVYHAVNADDECLNVARGVWMRVEHFPFTSNDAKLVGNMLEELFLSQSYIRAGEIQALLIQHLPSIGDNLSSLSASAVFNLVQYYLKNQFNFNGAMVCPKGAQVDIKMLYRGFASNHIHFTLTDLEAFASELDVPIYWESTFKGGAVRISETEFVHESQITFDVDATDSVLEDICPDNYLSLQAIPNVAMMHLPPCGYPWNGYLLLSYLYKFSHSFRFLYSSIGKTNYCGAMVKKAGNNINSYDELIECVLTEEDTWSSTSDVLALIVKQGYQARKRYSGIEDIMARAKQNKMMSEE